MNTTEELYDLFKQVPKAQIHLHLDGAPSFNRVKQILINEKNFSQEEAEKFVYIPEKYDGLVDFIHYFDKITPIIKTPEQIMQSTYDFCMKEFEDGVLYTEMRFAYRGDDEFQGVIDGITSAKKQIESNNSKSPDFRVILAGERHFQNEVENTFKKAVELSKKYPEFFVGVDIAGDEKNFSLKRFTKEFEFIKDKLPFTIHAGETPNSEDLSPTESMMMAIDFGAKRIGHGLALFADEKLVERVKKEKIGIETNPSSNYMIAGIEPKNHPLKRMLKEGILASFSTDDPPFFKASMPNELLKIYQAEIVTSWDEIKTLCLNGIKTAFLPESEKELKIKSFNDKFFELENDKFYGNIIKKLNKN